MVSINNKEVRELSCEYKEKVLNYLKNDLSDTEIEAHIEQCEQCGAMVDGYLEKEKELLPLIPKAEYTGENQNLKLKVIKYNRGKSRIVLFTIIGLIMGWLSFHYTSDSFFITKLIMAIPYKISEAIYTTLHHIPYMYQSEYRGVINEYFPESMLITFLAEKITPTLIGGAIYGSIGYFTGDKRIFTLSKYLRFALLWCGIILLWIGIVFAGDRISIRENSQLKDIKGFFLNAENHGSGFYEEEERSEGFEVLRKALGDVTLLKEIDDYQVTEHQATVEIYMGLGRCCLTTVNWDENYMILDTGRVVAVPKEFAQLVRQFYEGNGYFDEKNQNGKSEGGVEG
jgi:hypothetical protein